MSVAPVHDDCVEVIWEPIPGSQALAVSCPCNEILYDGSRGPGKTDAQLMRFRSLVGRGYGKHLRGVILDRAYGNLADLIAKSEKHFFAFKDGAKLLKAQGQLKWVWPTGEELLFRFIKKEGDYLNFHGQEFPFIGWNELTKYPNRKLYDLMKSCNRSGFLPEKHTPRLTAQAALAWNILYPLAHHEGRPWRGGDYATEDGKPLPEIPLQIFSTTNPWGPGHAWVKEQFVDCGEPGEVQYITTEVFNPRTKRREPVTRTQVRLFGTYKENIYLSPEYIASLENESDPERRKAWLLGDWNIRAGGMFNDIWKEHIHVVDNFPVPKNWRVDRAFDWGSSAPFSVGWYCEANGEAVTLNNGTRWAPRRGSVIRFAEWYGTSGGVNDGLRMSGPEIADGIMEREMDMLRAGIIKKLPEAGPGDPSIYAVREKDVASIGKKMEAEGIAWVPGDHSNGARINGWQLIRDMLTNSVRGEGPGLYFTKACKYAKKFMPDTPRDEEKPDDVDTDTEDHLQDELRYRVLDASRKWTIGLNTKRAR